MNAADALPGYQALQPAGTTFRNEVAARVIPAIVAYRPGRAAKKIAFPILFCVSDTDTVTPPAQTLRHARTAPRAEIKRYGAGHFDFYTGETFEELVRDQIEFLARQLNPAAAARRLRDRIASHPDRYALAMNFASLPDRRAALDPDGAAVSDGRQTLTNDQLLRRVQAAAQHLQDLGIGPGDVVAVKLTNRVEFVLLLFAAWRLGATITPVNPSMTDVEVARQLADSGARLVVREDGEVDGADATAVLAVGELRGGVVQPEQAPPPDPSALALLIYTSGTTGVPKGVMLDHANIDAMADMGRRALEVGPADRCLLILPLFHVNGIVISTLIPLLAGRERRHRRPLQPGHLLRRRRARASDLLQCRADDLQQARGAPGRDPAPTPRPCASGSAAPPRPPPSC
ncbi:AMP-binding protein [Streptomyces stelliscabiei]